MAEIPRNMNLEEAHNFRRDIAIEALKHQMERMVNLLEDDVPRRNRTKYENGDTTIVSSSTESEDEFEQLKIRTNVKEAEEHTKARFVGGLNASIADQVEMQPLWTFESACKLAIQVEKQAKKKTNFKSYSKSAMLTMKGQSSTLPKHNEAASKDKEQVVAGSFKEDRRKCFKCHGFGHFQAQCPNQQALTLKEIEDLERGFETEPAYDESDNKEFVATDIGLFLMVRRVMHSAESIEDKSQHENIIHSRSTIKSKVCSLIVDEGSCANAASAHMVEKLELVTKMHPHPNKLQWLNQGNEISHTSFKPSEIPIADPTTKNDKTLFMTQAEVDTELKGGTGAYLLLLVESDELNQHDEVPDGVKPLLSEFADVFPNELPAGLPPIRGIEHQIDLVPGSILPNKAAYRCSPHETKELEKQVNELVAKGYVRTSMSPYSVPTLLKIVFEWSSSTQSAFELLKMKLSSAPILALPNFDMLFELECDASGVGIGAVLVQGKRPVTYFREKLNGSKLNYSTYDKEFYAIIRAVDHWSHYLKPMQFVPFSDHEALKYINGQHKLNPRHAKWVEFLQMYSFLSKHKVGTSNVVADALSRRYSLLSILEARVLGFSFVKELYEADPDFAPILNCSPAEFKRDYVEHYGFLFKGSRLCISKDSIRELLIREAHGGGLAGHFGINKTLEILNEHFYWPCMDKDGKAVINRCATCFQDKSAFHKGLYTPLPVPNQP
ncbi:uncharacterized protein [Rutidosis leptorrhynchoides]|uniref:uncharacterized protein n=1 Tax=Rutidosis leptorrhynchoides TaxID=125765 RepID=UPI003A98F104